jgi:paxillin
MGGKQQWIPTSRSASGSTQSSGLAMTDLSAEENSQPSELAIDKIDEPASRRSSSSKRKSSSGSSRRHSSISSRVFSSQSVQSLFRNPDDKIYEEPEEPIVIPDRRASQVPPKVLGSFKKRRISGNVNSLRSRFEKQSPQDPVPQIKGKILSHTRQSGYVSNLKTPSFSEGLENQAPLEKRSQELRDATSMKRKDRSSNLPMPSVVTTKADRPIVSFDKNWQPKEDDLVSELLDGKKGTPIPVIDVNPIVNMAGVPTFNIQAPPSISVQEPSAERQRSRPLPTPNARYSRQEENFSNSTYHTKFSRPEQGRRPTAACMQCDLPIAGKVLTACGYRYHPDCFICNHCGENLELVAFYPEPEEKRAARLDRIHARARGHSIPDVEGETVADDGDDRARFFCHLDFHELFSPRCRSCKTPIEGEVVIACGGHWHVGHFFCAQCGDVSRLCKCLTILTTFDSPSILPSPLLRKKDLLGVLSAIQTASQTSARNADVL